MSFLFGLVEILVTYVFVGICMMFGILFISMLFYMLFNSDFREDWKKDKLIH